MGSVTDILIIGGPETAFADPAAKVRQVPFTFAGLAEAYRLLPEAETVIMMPDAAGVVSGMPTEDGIRCFHIADRKNPLIVVLEQFETRKYGLTPGVFLLKQRLDGLPQEKRSDFIRQANATAVELVLERVADIVAAGGKVFLLLPESDLPRLHPEDKTIITGLLPGIRIGHDRTWSARVDGKYAWLLEGVRPSLVFGCSGVLKRFPSLALKSLPKKSGASALSGAVDRGGGVRVIFFRIGRSEFVITSAVATENLLRRFGVVEKTDSEPPATNLPGVCAKPAVEKTGCEVPAREAEDSEVRGSDDGVVPTPPASDGPSTTCIAPGWKRGGLVLKRLPNGSTPALFSFCGKSYTVPSGKAWDVVHQMITANAFDGHGIPLKRPGDHFREAHRPFFTSRITKGESGWYIKTK